MTKSLRITGKNDDGEYWLHLDGEDQKAGLNLGDPKGMITSAVLMAASGHTFIRSDAPELVALVDALTQLRDLLCEGIEDDDGNSGCGQCGNDCTGCIAHAALSRVKGGEG